MDIPYSFPVGRAISRDCAAKAATPAVRATLEAVAPTELRVSPLSMGPDTHGYRPKKVISKWQLALTTEVALALFCRATPARANEFVIYGPAELQLAVADLAGRLISDTEPYIDREYLRVFYKHRNRGNVEAARGERERIIEDILRELRAALASTRRTFYNSAPVAVKTYLDQCEAAAVRLLPAPSRSRDREDSGTPQVDREKQERTAALQKAIAEAPPSLSQGRSDEDLEKIYGGILQRVHDLQPNGSAEGAAFDTRTKVFSVSAAIMAAEERLDQKPTRYTFRNGVLYVSADSPITPRWTRVRTTEGTGDE